MHSQSLPYSSYSENFFGLSVTQNFLSKMDTNYKKVSHHNKQMEPHREVIADQTVGVSGVCVCVGGVVVTYFFGGGCVDDVH